MAEGFDQNMTAASGEPLSGSDQTEIPFSTPSAVQPVVSGVLPTQTKADPNLSLALAEKDRAIDAEFTIVSEAVYGAQKSGLMEPKMGVFLHTSARMMENALEQALNSLETTKNEGKILNEQNGKLKVDIATLKERLSSGLTLARQAQVLGVLAGALLGTGLTTNIPANIPGWPFYGLGAVLLLLSIFTSSAKKE